MPKIQNTKQKTKYVYTTKKGLNKRVVENISYQKKEPLWMKDFRLRSYEIFKQKPLPMWGPDLSDINFNDIYYYMKATEGPANTWDELPENIRQTYEKIGIPQAEKNYLAGVTSQYDSETIYESLREDLEKQGVLFCDTDTALKKYPDIVKQYLATLIPPADNKFAALNSATWSGGSFIYIPKGVKVEFPLQAYFHIQMQNMGQFERTLIIADEGSRGSYIEGCASPIYSSNSLHSAVVEIIVKKGARFRYTTIQNWSTNVYNLVTKRAIVEEEGFMDWIDCNLGSRKTMKYPSFILKGKGAKGEVLSVALAGKGQHQDAGAKAIHLAPYTSSRIISKSISKDGGRTSYRGLIYVIQGAKKSNVYVSCDALIMDEGSRSDTYPSMKVKEKDVTVQHEAQVERLSDEKLFYLTSRGIKKQEAQGMLVNGFIKPVIKEIPLEYAVEMNRLINLEMEGSVG